MKINTLFSFPVLIALQAAALMWVPLWWSSLLIALAWALLHLPPTGKNRSKGKRPALFFFLAGLLSWGLTALWFHLRNQGLLTEKMAELFQLPSAALILLTAVLGGLLSMLGGGVGCRL